MKKNELKREFRINLSDMLQGFIEHCEISDYLIGRVEALHYYDGIKYGAPVFTHIGPPNQWRRRPVIGIVGRNTEASEVPTQISLQFLEILSQHPSLAGNSIIRMLPVSNPVTLERGYSSDVKAVRAIERKFVKEFENKCVDGLIRIETHEADEYVISGSLSPFYYEALDELLEGLNKEPAGLKLPIPRAIERVENRYDLDLTIKIPETWGDATQTLNVSKFMVHLFYTQVQLERAHNRIQRIRERI